MKKLKWSTIQPKFSGGNLFCLNVPITAYLHHPFLPPTSPGHTLYPSPLVYHPQWNPIYQPNPLASYEQQHCPPTNSSCNSNKPPLNFSPLLKPLS